MVYHQSAPLRLSQPAQFRSVQDGNYALGKAPIFVFFFFFCSTDRVSDVPPILPLNSCNVCLIDNGPLSSFQGRSSSVSSFHSSLLQAIGGVMSSALCTPLVSEAPQHFRSSETQATCDSDSFPPPACSGQ